MSKKGTIFNTIQLANTKSNTFDLSHDVKLSCQMGKLTPIMVMECVPGDRIRIGCESLIRFSPLVAPVMHRMDVTMHYFFVPNRLVWSGWEDFITNKTPNTIPTTTITPTDDERSLANYMGLPKPAANYTINAMPLAAYQMIYNEYYRDQNLIPEVNYNLVNGDNSGNTDLKEFRTRAWEHDYFTSALPFAQAGAPVSIPLGDVVLKPDWVTQYPTTPPNFKGPVLETGGGQVNQVLDLGGTASLETGMVTPVAYDPANSLEVASTTINDLRQSFRLQEWLERSARVGRRYIETILGHFGVKSSDARLNRPEYITGIKSPVVISEVLNTAGETGGLPQGNQAGHAVSVTSGEYGSYYAEEHGYVIGVMSILPKTAYQQGVPKHYLKFDTLDYYWPTFAHLGEQEIENQELYVDSANPTDTFGYVPRYSEYKFMPSRVAGQFQSTLDFYHMGRIFATEPALNEQFVTADPTKRIFAVTSPTDDELYCHVLNKVKANRKMPIYGTPTF